MNFPSTQKKLVSSSSFKNSFLARLGFLPLATLGFCLMFFLVEPRFGSISNIRNIFFQAGLIALVSFGQFFPILSGGIDFSIGAQIGLASIVGSMLLVKMGIIIGIFGALCVLAVVGFLIGFVVVKFKANSMIVSLGMYWVASGFTLLISNGQNIYNLPKGFTAIGVSRIAGVPITVIWAILAFLLCYFLLNKTRYGYHLYAVGANERTAELSGISVGFTRIMSYVVCSLFAGFTGLVLTASLGSGQPSLGTDLALLNIVVVFVAGTKWGGGEGSIINVAIAVLFMAVLTNGLNVLNVPSYVQTIVSGVILLVVLSKANVSFSSESRSS